MKKWKIEDIKWVFKYIFKGLLTVHSMEAPSQAWMEWRKIGMTTRSPRSPPTSSVSKIQIFHSMSQKLPSQRKLARPTQAYQLRVSVSLPRIRNHHTEFWRTRSSTSQDKEDKEVSSQTPWRHPFTNRETNLVLAVDPHSNFLIIWS